MIDAFVCIFSFCSIFSSTVFYYFFFTLYLSPSSYFIFFYLEVYYYRRYASSKWGRIRKRDRKTRNKKSEREKSVPIEKWNTAWIERNKKDHLRTMIFISLVMYIHTFYSIVDSPYRPQTPMPFNHCEKHAPNVRASNSDTASQRERERTEKKKVKKKEIVYIVNTFSLYHIIFILLFFLCVRIFI